ncbi:hypothetical protein ACU8OT_29385 (plasmid) [Rhizobium leguminosarum]
MNNILLFISLSVLASCSTIESSVPRPAKYGTVKGTGTYMLPRTILNVNVKTTKDGKAITITKTAEGDPRAVRNYTITPSPFSTDIVKVEQVDNLLTKVSSDASDQSGNIALNLAELVFTTASGGASLPANMRSLSSAAPGADTQFSGSYDPFDPVDAASARQGLAENGYCITVGAETVLAPNLACSGSYRAAEDPRFARSASYESDISGIWFRRTVPTPVRIYQRAGNATPWKLLFSGNEDLFDKSALYQLEIDRAPFVQKKVEVTFASGSMTTVSVDQPSTLAAATAVPVKIARIIFAIPLAGFQQDEALAAAKTKLLTQQASLVKAQRDYIALGVSATGDSSRALVINEASRAELSDPSRVLSTSTGRTLVVQQNPSLQNCLEQTEKSAEECAAIIAKEQNP